MKKLYTLFAAAAVGALACSAVNPNPVSPALKGIQEFNFPTMEVSQQKVAEVNKALGIQKAAAEVQAPASLEDMGLTLCYDFKYNQDWVPLTNTLNLKKVAEEEGVIQYEATGFLDGLFLETVTVHPLEVLYEPASGTLVIPAGQTTITFQGNDYVIYNYRSNGYLYDGVGLYFSYNGSGFDWVNPMNVQFESGVEEFESQGFLGGRIIQENGQNKVEPVYIIDNPAFRIAQGTMKFTADLIDQTTHQTTAVDQEGPLFASVSGKTLTVENFGSPILEFVVGFDIDAQAKTLTAEDVQVGKLETGQPLFLSSAKDLFNVYEDEGKYMIVAKYTCSGNTTTVEVGEWNAFFYDSATKEDTNAYVPFYNTVMIFNFNLDTIMAGVGNIAVDEADADAPVEYFNLQGIRVQNPENGLYIRRQGKNVTKVVL